MELDVPDGEITVRSDVGVAGGKVLTLKGFTTLLDTVATAVDAMHTAYQKRFQ